jgi:beta-galactosidase
MKFENRVRRIAIGFSSSLAGNTFWLVFLNLLVLSRPLAAQTYSPPSTSRQDINLDANWLFIQQDVANAQNVGFDDSSWTNLNLPHTWDIADGQDGPQTTYYEGIGWYRSYFAVASTNAGLHFFLKFDGAFLVSDVWVNGTYLGEHQGGFGAFVFDVTTNILVGMTNLIAVKLNNSVNDNIPPIEGDFTHWGGIYRDVHLLVTDPVQVSPLDYGSPGVYLMPTNVSASSANLQVTTVLANTSPGATNVMVRTVITDAATNMVTTLTNFVTLPAGSSSNVVASTIISNPHLWNGLSDPYLYQAFVEVWKGTNAADLVAQPLGFRFFSMNPTNGFYLNGVQYDLHGVSMHQDWLNCGWALTNAQRDTNFMFIKEIGATALRMPHYEHNDYEYTLADQNGILVWSEVPNIESVPSSYSNTLRQVHELIRQRFNHPSVICWGMYNEIVAGTGSTNIIGQEVQVAHADDPTRPATAASNVAYNDPTTLWTDVISFNEYYGWYDTPINGLAGWMDNAHTNLPARPTGLSEYGAGGSIYQHSENPVAWPTTDNGPFHPEEWQDLVHETNWFIIKARPYLWTKFVWNLFDFASDTRDEGDTPGRNDKGLVTYDRQIRKDAFYFYKANWTTNPMVYITGHTFTNRINNITAKVYANCDTVQLYVNGISQGAIAGTNCIDCVFTWPVTLISGSNNVFAVGTKGGIQVTDSLVWAGPIPPVSLAAAPGNAQIALIWSASQGATNYVLQRSTTSGGPYSTIISTTNTSYVDTGLINGTNYYYVVYAVSLYGQNLPSPEASATPLVSVPGAYWINPNTTSPQSWDVSSNWNGGVFPNSTQIPAIVKTAISANQTINLNQTITIGILSLGASGGAAAFNIAGNGGTLTFDNTPGPAGLLQFASSAGDTISAPVIINGALNVTNASTNTLTLSGAISAASGITVNGNVALNGTNTYSGATAINGGTLLVNGINGASPITVASGGTLGGTGTISGSATWLSGASAFLTQGSPLTVSGSITLNTNTVTVHVPGSTPLGAGTYTLMTYNATGSSGSFMTIPVVTGAGLTNGNTAAITNSAGVVTLSVFPSVTATWNVNANGNWSAGSNWSSNPGVPHDAGDSAAFGVGTSLRTVTLDANESVGAIFMTNANSFVIANSGMTLTLDNMGSGAAISVTAGTTNAIQTPVALNDNTTVTVSGGESLAISGKVANSSASKTLTVNGAGTLALSGANTYGPSSPGTAGTLLSGGILQAGNNSALGAGDLIVAGNATLQSGGTGLSVSNNIAVGSGATMTVDNNGNTLTLGGVISGGGVLSATNNGKVVLAGMNTYTNNTTILGGNLTVSGGTINAPNSTITVGNGATGVSFVVTGGTVTANTLNVAPVGGSTGDNASITGSGSAAFANVNLGGGGDTSGPLTINTTGSVALGTLIDYKDLEGNGPSKTSGLIINGGAVAASSIIIQETGSGANMNMTGGSLTIGNASSTGAFKIGNSTSTRGGWLTMTGGALTYLGTDGLLLNTASGGANGANISGATAVATLTGVTLNQVNAAGATSWLVVSNGAALYLGGAGLVINQPTNTVFASLGTATIGAITNWSSSAPITLTGTTTFRAADISSVAHNISLGGVLSGGGGLTKTGGGTLTLSGTNTYSGSTAVNAGTLLANNPAGSATGSGGVTVASGGALGGSGIISGSTTVNSGGTLWPGNPFGTLTFGASLTLAAGSTNLFAISASPLTNDAAKVSGALTCGGTLIVTNMGSAALANGDSFKLFNAASYSGAFAKAILPPLPAGLGWNTNNLNTSGTLSVVVTTKPVIGSISISGNGLAFNGAGGVGSANFYLLGTTNLVSPLSNWTRLLTNQFDINGNFNFTSSIPPVSPQNFYLLQLP